MERPRRLPASSGVDASVDIGKEYSRCACSEETARPSWDAQTSLG